MSNIHTASNHHTNTNKDAKNTSTDNSTFLNIDFGSLWGDTHKSNADAPSIATQDAGSPMYSWIKNSNITENNTINVFLRIIGFCKHLFASIFWIDLIPFSWVVNHFLCEWRIYNNTKNHINITTGNVWKRKSVKLNHAADPIIIFGGSQINVPTQAIFDKTASANNIGTGLIFNIFVTINVIGTTNIIVVTLSKNIDNTEVNHANHKSNNPVFPCVFFATKIAKYCKNHVFSSSVTITIIHNSKSIVLKSIDAIILSGV